MAVYNVGKDQVEFTIESSINCKLCLCDVDLAETYELKSCKCAFCKTCLKQYLTILVSEGNVLNINCPDGACKKHNQLQISEIELLVDQPTFDKYHRLKFEREVELDPARTFCPEAGCETICHVCSTSPNGKSTQPKPVNCHTCGLIFCAVCKSKWHGSQSCDDYMKKDKRDEAGIPFHCPEESAIKRCPLCQVPIERNDGCAQMMCRRCKHVFCWYCLASLDDDFLLRHYDKGPCKNKLGHSRASVIWHRTQVVGIFAGFTVLLLVASPFLLLAAPCILCCKCKVCKCCEDEDIGTPEGMSSV